MSIEKPRILVVDDNPATLYSTSRVLRGAGWDVLEAESGEKALTLVGNSVDLVVLDINLPGIDGFEVCRQIRENPNTKRIPVVHLSATFVTDSHKVHGLEAGADGYLTHPVEPPVLTATVRAFLRARQAENEAQKNQARFKALFESVIIGVCMLDDEMAFIDVNPAFCEILGIKREGLLGNKLLNLITEADRFQFSAITNEISAHGSWRGHFPLQSFSGKSVELEWNVSVDSALGMRLAIVTDISERLANEREREQLLNRERISLANAERANRLKDEFLATLSHELRNPLNTMVGWTQLLRLQQPTEDDLREGLESIERNALLQAQMINDLLDISRITSGKIHLDLQPVDLNPIIDQALSTVATLAVLKRIQVRTNYESTPMKISADPLRLQQIVWNLVNNAVKFTPDGGNVGVSSRRKDHFVEIEVLDDGIGIREDFLPYIFDRFRQADPSSTREQGGLGLGLAIVKQLIEAHGGSISVFSEGENTGSRFKVSIPVAGTPQSVEQNDRNDRQASQQSSDIANKLNGTRVLVVEDDPDSREMLQKVIRVAGGNVRASERVFDALQQIVDFKPQVLVSDLGLPIHDGYYLIREIRRSGLTAKELPAIALTAFLGAADKNRAIECGFQGFLGKPFDSAELVALISEILLS